MSEVINNREFRQQALKEIIQALHNGQTVEAARARFEEVFQGVSAAEIAEMEQALIGEGMPVTEIQRLCDVHAAVFKGSIEEIHRETKSEGVPGHPIHTFRQENRALEQLIDGTIRPLVERMRAIGGQETQESLKEALGILLEVDKHYRRKENLLFPYLEKYGATAPPKVMWGVDDEIRAAIKKMRTQLAEKGQTARKLAEGVEETVGRVLDMIFKEEKIMFPMALEKISEDEWYGILRDSDEFGYCLVDVTNDWRPVNENVQQMTAGATASKNGALQFDPGALLPEEIRHIFNTLPLDITFVDKNGVVKYFSQGKERIFARPASVIGRRVENCHPPASVHIVEQIVEELKSGKKDHEDFWIHMGSTYAYIRYFAVRNDAGDFLGVMEVTQDIGPIQEITGEKRLVTGKNVAKESV